MHQFHFSIHFIWGPKSKLRLSSLHVILSPHSDFPSISLSPLSLSIIDASNSLASFLVSNFHLLFSPSPLHTKQRRSLSFHRSFQSASILPSLRSFFTEIGTDYVKENREFEQTNIKLVLREAVQIICC